MKKILWMALLLSLLMIQNVAQCSTTKFMVLSDVHISTSKKNVGARQLTQSINFLQKAVKQVNEADVDFVIFSGDVIDTTDKNSLVMFAKIINKLEKPYYVILGNHDVAQFLGIDKKEFYRLVNKFSKNKIKKVPTVRVMENNLVFIFMDGVNQFIPGSSGYYKEEELMWLDKKLNKYKNQKVVIVQHYPLVPPYYRRSHMTHKADEYLKMLEGHKNVIAIISGHFHSEGETLQNEVVHISVPSLVQSGEYKEIIIEQGLKADDFVIKSKIFSIQQ